MKDIFHYNWPIFVSKVELSRINLSEQIEFLFRRFIYVQRNYVKMEIAPKATCIPIMTCAYVVI